MSGPVDVPAPELSVVVAAYNAAATLGEQLAALAAEPVPCAWELVVADNGSTDGTADLARSWADRLPLRVVDASARRGPGPARNIGVAHARGRLVAFCDADDIVGTGWLAAMHAALQTDEFVTGSWEVARLNAKPDWQGLRPAVVWLPFFPLPGAGSGNLGVHRAVFDEVGGFEESLETGEDMDLAWRIQLAGHPLSYHPEVVLHVRNRDRPRAVFRQMYTWVAGDAQLKHRYEKVIAAYDERGPGHAAAPAAAFTAPDEPGMRARLGRGVSRAGSLVGRLARLRGLPDFTHHSKRFGLWLGAKLARPDTSRPQLEPPSALPDPVARIALEGGS